MSTWEFRIGVLLWDSSIVQSELFTLAVFLVTGGQEEVREADGQVLSEPGALPQPVHQETGHCTARGMLRVGLH